MRQPLAGELATTVATLDWLIVMVEEEGPSPTAAEITEPLRFARAFAAATLAHTNTQEKEQ